MVAVVTAGNLKTIEELSWKIVNTITAGCKRVDLLEVIKRHLGKTQRLRIEVLEKNSWSNLLKVKSDTGSTSWNALTTKLGMFGYIQTAKVKILNKVRTRIMYLSQESQCCSVTLPSQNKIAEELASSHKEGDYRLLVSYVFNQL